MSNPKYKMLVNARDFDQLRVAIVNEKGLPEQVDFESLNNANNLGNIYKGTITAIEPSLQASFVDYGGNRHGFLPFNEMHHRYFLNNDRRLPVGERIKKGQEVIVQIAREEIGLKGAYLTTYLSLPGQYLVMMPLSNKVGISRKIEGQKDRAALREILDQITVPEDIGYIIRTAGMGKSREQLQRDLNLLLSTWKELESLAKKRPSPSILYREDDVVSRTIRDYFNEDITQILVDDAEAYASISKYFKKVLPSFANIVKLYRGRTPIFTKYRLDNEFEKIFAKKILLPSGGSIVIEQTEALVVVDVNSGKTSEGDLESTALKANMEAADEVARQLRLRDLGGLVVIDFIDLKSRKHSREVEKCLRDALKEDKARITVTGVSRFGLLEMSRQRINTSKENRHFVDCHHCHGMGRIKSDDLQAVDVLRRIKYQILNNTVKEIIVTCSEVLGTYLLNDRRVDLSEMETRYNTSIRIKAQPGFFDVPSFELVRRTQEEKKEMVMPPPLSLSSMAASMSEQAINEQKDYREEKLAALDKLSFEELRNADVPVPNEATPFDRFNFTVRVALMKRHGLFESRMDEFKQSIRTKIMGEDKQEDDNQDGNEDTAQSDDDSKENKSRSRGGNRRRRS